MSGYRDRVAHPYGLTDTEHAAILALQNRTPLPGLDEEVWKPLLEMGLVWVDRLEFVHEIRLTPLGRRYPS